MRYTHPVLALILALALGQEGHAESALVKEKALQQGCTKGAPAIELSEAIKLAMAALALMDTPDQHYIDTAQLSCQQKNWVWQIGFRSRKKETGQIVLTIDMQAKVKASVRKDG